MGRPKGSKNKPKVSTAEPDLTTDGAQTETSPGIGDNTKPPELTEDQKFVLVDQHAKRIQDLKATAAKYLQKARAAYKAAKSDLGKDAKRMVDAWIESETEEGEAALKERIELQTSVLRRRGTPVVQLDLFPASDPLPGVERAREAGKLAGMKGETARPPHDPSVAQYQAWLDGWQDGQSVLMANLIKPLDEPEPGAELIPAGEQAARDAARLAEHDARAADDEPEETTAEAEQRLRTDAVMGEELDKLAAGYGNGADDGLDIPASLDRRARLGDRPATFRDVN